VVVNPAVFDGVVGVISGVVVPLPADKVPLVKAVIVNFEVAGVLVPA